MSIERDGIIYKFTKLVPMPRLDKQGRITIGWWEVPKDPYDMRTEERIKAGRPPEEPPVELAQNE